MWGVLAVAAQWWVALIFVRWVMTAWKDNRPYLVSFAESTNRFSQLKTPALKYPWAGVYFVLAAAAIVGLVGWLVVGGVRDAIAPPPETDDADRTP